MPSIDSALGVSRLFGVREGKRVGMVAGLIEDDRRREMQLAS